MKPPTWKQTEEEIAHHLELEARKRGEHQHAEAAFGGVDRVLEECRDQRRWTWLQDFGRDLTFGLRRLRRTPGFALIAVATLALGIGANTALFTLVNTVLLRSLPVPHAEQLVLLGNPDFSGVEIGTSDHDVDALTYMQYSRLRQQNQVFSGVLAAAAEELTIRIGPAGGGSAEAGPIAGVEMVSANYFDVLEVRPERGRFFDPVEDTSAAAPEVVISDGFWHSEFHGDPGMVGRTLRMRSTVFTVVGVAPAGFGGISVGFVPDIYAPLQLQRRVWPGRDLLHDPPSIRRASWLLALGRLKPGATAPQAKADCNLIFGQTVREQAALASDAQIKADLLTQRLPVSAGGRGASALREQFGKPLWLLFALVGVVLLVVAVNLGGMLLAQASTREREFAMRLALGARRTRLVRQLLTESLMLAAAGGVAGFWLARLGESALVGLVATPDSGLSLSLNSDWRVMGFTAATCLLVGIGFGMTPALRLARTQLTVKTEHRRVPAANALVVAQVALSIVLVTGAALFVRSLDQLRQVQLGYSPVNLVTFNVNAVAGGASGAVAVDMYQKITDAVAHLPGVKGATFSENGLFTGRESGDGVKVEGYTGSEPPSAAMDKIAPGYFAQLGVPVLLGREFTATDRSRALKPVIVDQAFVNHYFQHVNPLGKLVTVLFSDDTMPAEVVGVTAVAHQQSLREKPNEPRLYLDIFNGRTLTDLHDVNFEVRVATPASLDRTMVRKAVAEAVGPTAQVNRFGSIEAAIESTLAPDLLLVKLTGFFGVLALGLAAMGLYAMLSYAVARRRGEIGIRMALGARAATVRAMVLGEAMKLVGIGVAIGAVISLAETRAIASLLYDLSPDDPASLGMAALLLAAVGLAAAYLPARQASRVDPLPSLRQNNQ